MSSWCTSLAIPKSVTLHFSPSPTRTFLAAKSRWIIYMTFFFFLHKGFFKNRIKIKIILFLKLCLGPLHVSPVSKISLIYLQIHCVHMRGWPGSVPGISIFPTMILETGLKFLIWTPREICPGSRAQLKKPVNLISSIYQLSNMHDNSLKTITWYSKTSNPIQYG